MKLLKYKLTQDYNTFGCFIPAGTTSRQLTEREFEERGVLPDLRHYNETFYFSFNNVTLPVTIKTIEGWPNWFEEIEEQ